LSDHYDFIVIGSGAGGSTLAHRLAGTGASILVLERGDFIPRENANWDAHEVFTAGRYRTGERWLDDQGAEFEPFTHYCVGGNTKMFGAALLRLRESDFEQVQHFGGISPKWPIAYSDLEAYYLEVEQLYSVHGRRGMDPTEPPSSGEYPFDPLPHEPRIQQLFEDFAAQGVRPFPLPIAVRLPQDHDRGDAPIKLGKFDGFPDPTEAKADSHVVALRRALAHDNVTLLTGCRVDRLLMSPDGRAVTVVEAQRQGEQLQFRANVVVVACGAINSAALMLRSANDHHPHGLANSSDMVGRHYMSHINGAVIAISDTENDAEFQKTFGVADFYHGADDSKHPLGLIQLMGKTDLDSLADQIKDLTPKRSAADVSRHSIDFWLTSEDLPLPDNRVKLAADGRVQITYRRNNVEAYRRLKGKLMGLLEGAGCSAHLHRDTTYVGYDLSVSGVSHQSGTMRFGQDPATSVLDTNCKAHDLDNLYVVDSSFFCSAGAVNPSLTIMANALRIADHLRTRMAGASS
jgi:choline dehydrogenase-like flavoprotein